MECVECHHMKHNTNQINRNSETECQLPWTSQEIRNELNRLVQEGIVGRVERINPESGKMEWAYYKLTK